jgi:hypothetical protein
LKEVNDEIKNKIEDKRICQKMKTDPFYFEWVRKTPNTIYIKVPPSDVIWFKSR